MKTLLKDDYLSYLECFNEAPVSSIRISNYKISTEDFLRLSPFNTSKIDWIHNGFYISDEDKPGKHPYYAAGLYYIQEASAMTPAECLDIEEGDFVLDCCAAPGGKTTELLSKLKDTGLLIANDISTSRAYGLARNIQRLGFTNAFVTAEDTTKLTRYFNAFFDKILVDAPCSGEGMFRKDPSLIKAWNDKDSSYYPPLQKEILASAIKMLKPGGHLLYSTCTFALKEDEEVIEEILERNPDLKVIELPLKYEHFEHGLTANTGNAARLYPHKLKGEGHFVCLLEKEGTPVKSTYLTCPSYKLNEDTGSFLNDCKINTRNRHYELIGEELYLVPDIPVKLKGLRIILSGLHLGTLKKDRFTPSSPLALAIKEYPRIFNMSADDIRLDKFLKGETITLPKDYKGYVLVCVDHYPLGFGKADKGLLKNRIEKGWIRQ